METSLFLKKNNENEIITNLLIKKKDKKYQPVNSPRQPSPRVNSDSVLAWLRLWKKWGKNTRDTKIY